MKASLPPILTDMRQFLTRLIARYEPQPAGKDTVTSMINAGEEGVAVEIIAENYYEHDVALTAEEKSELKEIGERLQLSQDYLEMINELPLVAP